MNAFHTSGSTRARRTGMCGTMAQVAIAFLVVTTGTAAAASGKTISRVPCIIKKPGLYVLAKNITTPITAGAAILVAANNVTIDMKGYGITCVPASPGTATLATGVYASGFSRVTVRNGSIEGFLLGIYIKHDTYDTAPVVEDMTVARSRNTGICMEGSAVLVRRCSVLNTTGSVVFAGISVLSAGAHVADCHVYNTDSLGVSPVYGIIVASTGATIERNHVINPVLRVNKYGIRTMGALFINDNHIANMDQGVTADSNTKLARNLTVNCNTSFDGGTLVEGNN